MAISESQNLKKYEALALKLLRKELGSYVEKVTVREDIDYDDEPALFIDAILSEKAPADLGKKFIFSHLYLRRELERVGENRFPYLTTRRPKSDNRPTDFILSSKTGQGSKSKRRAS